MAVIVCAAGAHLHAADTPNAFRVLLTADGEGHTEPCANCPAGVGHGGMARRATLIARVRQESPLLLVDAGNSVFGGDSAASSGKVIVAAHDALGYDAVNVCYRDFRLGKDATIKTFTGAKLAVLSANLLQDDGQLLFKPYVVRNVAGKRVAIVGVTEPPAGLAALPHLKKQLEGIRFRPVAEALAEWLPKARAESDSVVLLYYGSPRGVTKVRDQFAPQLAALLVGGIRPDALPAGDDAAAKSLPPTVASGEHGKSIGFVRLASIDPAAAVAEANLGQIAIDPALPGDPAMAKLLNEFPADVIPASVAGATTRPAVPTSQPAVLSPPVVVVPPATLPFATTQPATAPVAVTPPAIIPPPPATLPVAPAVAGPPRVTAKQPHVARGLPGVGLTQEQVDAAVRRGAAYLWPHVLKECGNPPVIGGNGGAYEGYHTLAALALVKAGLHMRDPEFNRMLRDYLDRVQPETIGTYAAGLLCMLIEAYGDPRYEPKLRASARYLFEGLSSRGWDYRPKVSDAAMRDPRTQKALQVWGGRPPLGSGAAASEKWNRATTQKADELDHDNSLVQFAVLGLQAAARSGVEVPADVWRQVVDMMRTRQSESGGWGYVGATSAVTGSMTCAATYSLTVARFQLGEKTPAEDESIERGLGSLASVFSVSKNPGANAYLYYYLYSLERLGRTIDSEFIGPSEWYPMGAKYLLGVQKENGSWHDVANENQIILETSFAILFLARGTPKLVAAPEVKQGPGVLKTGLIQPPSPRLYIILDCSGSMMAEMNGQAKFDVARQSITTLLAELPDSTQLALRAYGHRKTALDPGANDDTELLVPMGPLDRPAIAEQLKRLRARGRTPMARSLQASKEDIDGISDKRMEVLLLTDGGEDSQPRQDPVAAAAAIGKSREAMLHVVGFDIDREDWGKQLRAMAEAGRGRYWAAGDSGALLAELRAAVLRSPGSYEIHDVAERVVHKGMFGDNASLEPGHYSFVTAFGGRKFNEPFWVNAGEPTAVLFDAGKFGIAEPKGEPPPASPATYPAVGPDPVVASPPKTPAVPANRPKFCVHCGKPLAATGNFCTNCGKKIGP